MSKKIKLYTYNLLRILITIILFPIIFIWSNRLFKKYKYFCYTYPRFGKNVGPKGEFSHIPVETNSLEYHYWDLNKMNLNNNSFTKDEIEEFTIESKKGLISCLKAINENSNKWVIGLHGWTEDKFLALRLVRHYFEQGYNILTFDAFAHGKSYGENTDIGYSSIEMMDEIIFNLKKQYEVKNLGLIGNSMGASTSVLYSQLGKYNRDISWVISDCGFSSIKLQYRFYIQNNFFKKPWWLIGFGYTRKFSKLTKTNQNKYNLLKLMKFNSEVPIFFIHAIGDTFIPYEMSLDMYNKKINFESHTLSEIWTPVGSNHVYVISDYYNDYVEKTVNFANEREKKINEN